MRHPGTRRSAVSFIIAHLVFRRLRPSAGPNYRAGVRGVALFIFFLSWSANSADVEAIVMSLSELASGLPEVGEVPHVAGPVRRPQTLHRIAEVRQQQGITLRTVARHTGVEVRQLRREEEESSDLRLTDLYRWQDALDVPVGDLLVESNAPLSTPVMERARMVKVMKTVAAIMETSQSLSTQRLAQTLANQLVEIMPELEGVSPWPAIGQRRSLDDYGVAAERRLSGRILRDEP